MWQLNQLTSVFPTPAPPPPICPSWSSCDRLQPHNDNFFYLNDKKLTFLFLYLINKSLFPFTQRVVLFSCKFIVKNRLSLSQMCPCFPTENIILLFFDFGLWSFWILIGTESFKSSVWKYGLKFLEFQWISCKSAAE